MEFTPLARLRRRRSKIAQRDYQHIVMSIMSHVN
jgi:hypothetical protein